MPTLIADAPTSLRVIRQDWGTPDPIVFRATAAPSQPCWFLVGGHLAGSKLTAWRLRSQRDRDHAPTLDEALAELGPRFRFCGCRACRRPAVVWAWYGGDAVALAKAA